MRRLPQLSPVPTIRGLKSVSISRGEIGNRLLWYYGRNMASVKMTFSLDEVTAHRLNQTAERLEMAKSAVVREAILEYADRTGRLSEKERRRLLRAFDDLVPKIPDRPTGEVEAELAEIRRARRAGGRTAPERTDRS